MISELSDIIHIREETIARINSNLRLDDNGCFIWTGIATDCGYGKIKVIGQTCLVHRIVWICTNGSIPYGLLICHKCDVPQCCNPAHLFIGTHKDNANDRDTKNRQSHQKGMSHASSILTDSAVTEIRIRYNSSAVTQQVLSDEYGVSRSQICRIVNRKGWSHLA